MLQRNKGTIIYVMGLMRIVISEFYESTRGDYGGFRGRENMGFGKRGEFVIITIIVVVVGD